MKPSQLQELLKAAIAARLPVLIKGAPGVGKTDLVTQAARAAGADLVIGHPVVGEPIDYTRLPAIPKDHAEFPPSGALRKLIDADRPTVYFIDDLGQAPPAVRDAAMQLILARRINGCAVTDQVCFMAATTRKRDRAGAAGIPEALKSRFVSIVELVPDVEDWAAWAISYNLPPELIAFIRFQPQLLLDSNPTSKMKNSPCPRTVANVGKLMAIGLPEPLEFEAYAGAAGKCFAAELMGFLKICRQLPDPRLILMNTEEAIVPNDPATLHAVCAALARLARPGSMDVLVNYAMHLPEAFSVLLLNDSERLNPSIVNTPAYARWAARHHRVMN